MRILCVDDEAPVLELTVSMCRALPQKPEVKGFAKAADALDWLEMHSADIALLDIHLPDMDGITLAEKIKAGHPEIAVIFLTGDAGYALEAFRLHASGYLLKPVSPARLAAEVDYAMAGRPQRSVPKHIAVKTFGCFEVAVDGAAVMFSRAKAKELLAYLIDRQGSGVTRAEAFSILWENGTYDRSMQKQLDVIVRSLRDTLQRHGISEMFEIKSGVMRVLPDRFDCDLYRFLNGDADAVNAYRGEYLNAYPWANMTEAYVTQSQKQTGGHAPRRLRT